MSNPSFQYFRDSNGQLWSINVNPNGTLTTTAVSTGTPTPDGSIPVGTLLASDILDACIRDAQVRTTNRIALLDYLGRVVSRMLRESQWVLLKSQYHSFPTVPGTNSYYIGLGPVPAGAIDTGLLLGDVQNLLTNEVFDVTNLRQLFPDSPKLIATSILTDPPKTFEYNITNYGLLNIYPVGATATPATILFRYLKTRQKIAASTDIITQIPDDYRDVLIAGVNYYACLYMDHDSGYAKAASWKGEYLDGIRQMRKDLNIGFRNTDVMLPDAQTQASANAPYGQII